MKIDFDQKKSDKNANDRGLAFEKVAEFDWDTALYIEDNRKLYRERRFVAMGYIDQRLYVVCFTPIDGGVRIISFKKANLREVKRYEKETSNN